MAAGFSGAANVVKSILMSDPETPMESESEYAQLPPATFEFLISSVDMQARMALGVIHFGEEKDRPKPDLHVARYHIDMLNMLQQKTRGNLSLEEQRMLENSLTELRFRFVQASEELVKPAAQKT